MSETPIRRSFPVDEPVYPEERMIGRGDDVAQLCARLSDGENPWMSAPRRTGKTTVARAVLGRLRQRGWLAVEVSAADLERRRTTAVDALTDTLTTRTLAEAGGRRTLERDLMAAGRRLWPRLRDLLPLDVREIADSVAAFLPSEEQSQAEQLARGLRLADQLVSHRGGDAVVLLDEAHRLEALADANMVCDQLRAAARDSRRTRFLLCGVSLPESLFADEMLGPFGIRHTLSEIGAQAWHAGLRRRFDEVGVAIDEDGLDRLVARGGGRERDTMLLAARCAATVRDDPTLGLRLSAVMVSVIANSLDMPEET